MAITKAKVIVTACNQTNPPTKNAPLALTIEKGTHAMHADVKEAIGFQKTNAITIHINASGTPVNKAIFIIGQLNVSLILHKTASVIFIYFPFMIGFA